MPLEVVVLGVGAGATCTYTGECSSSFIICLDGQPVLMMDVGLGSVRAALQAVGSLPPYVYVSHNHSDHAGELPVLLAVEAAAGRRKVVLAEPDVMYRLQEHRLAELASTGLPLSSFGDFQACPAGQLQPLLPCGQLSLQPLQSRHAERCFGLLLYWQGQPLLGWTADSGYDEALYRQLSVAPVVLLDGRAAGTSEHAGFDELQAAVAAGVFGCATPYVFGYGCIADAPACSHPGLGILKPGSRLCLGQPASQAPPRSVGGGGAQARAADDASRDCPAGGSASLAARAVRQLLSPEKECVSHTILQSLPHWQTVRTRLLGIAAWFDSSFNNRYVPIYEQGQTPHGIHAVANVGMHISIRLSARRREVK